MMDEGAGGLGNSTNIMWYIDYSFTETEHSSVRFHSFPAKTIIPPRLYIQTFFCTSVLKWTELDPLSGFSGLFAPEESPSLDHQGLHMMTKLDFKQATLLK